MKRIILALALLMAPLAAQAANCSGYPYTLANGQTADANQVMSNFNNILSCANSNLAKSGVNSDITQFTNSITFGSSISGTTAAFTGAVTMGGAVNANNGTTTGGTLTFGTGANNALSGSGSTLTLGSGSYTAVSSAAAWTHTGAFSASGLLTGTGGLSLSGGAGIAGGVTVSSGGVSVTGGLGADSLAASGFVASATDVKTGTSTTKVVTPASLNTNAHTFGSTGYMTLPNGAIMIWGTGTSSGTAAGNLSVSFPVHLPTGCMTYWASVPSSGTSTYSANPTTCTTTGATYTVTGVAGGGSSILNGITVQYVIIGY